MKEMEKVRDKVDEGSLEKNPFMIKLWLIIKLSNIFKKPDQVKSGKKVLEISWFDWVGLYFQPSSIKTKQTTKQRKLVKEGEL